MKNRMKKQLNKSIQNLSFDKKFTRIKKNITLM
jgi:hypothetical protein